MRIWNVLLVVSLGVFLVSLDGMMMSVAFDPIIRGLQTTVSTFQAAIVIHGLMMASLYLTGGRLGDVYGKKRMLQLGSLLFGIGTLIASLSPNAAFLIIGWSIIKPIGGMLILTASLALILLNYTEKQRTFAFGVYGSAGGVAAMIGPLLMGVLSEHLTWRLAFGLESLLAVVTLGLAISIQETEKRSGVSFDWLGTVLSLIGLASLVLGIDQAEHYGWWEAKKNLTLGDFQLNLWGLSPVPYMVMLGIVLLVIFVNYQQKRIEQGKMPLLERQLFANGQFMTGLTSEVFVSAALAGFGFIIPLVLQSAPVHLTVLQTGLVLLPYTIAIFVFSLLSSSLSRRFAPKYVIQFGLILTLVGILALGRGTYTHINVWAMLPGLFVVGMGNGIAFPQLSDLTLSAIPEKQSGMGTGVEETFREIGLALGTAILGSLLINASYANFVDLVAQQKDLVVSPAQKEEMIEKIQGAFQTMTVIEEEDFIAQLALKDMHSFELDIGTAIVRAKRTAFAGIFATLLIGMSCSAFLPTKKAQSNRAK